MNGVYKEVHERISFFSHDILAYSFEMNNSIINFTNTVTLIL